MSIDDPSPARELAPPEPAANRATAPDYHLEPSVLADSPAQFKAIANPVRSQILDLVLDRAATVGELAEALARPKSSVAHHVGVLVEAGLLAVVRTRRVRAIDERFYGRTGRTIVIGNASTPEGSSRKSMLHEAAAEVPSDAEVWSTLRHVRVPADQAERFFDAVVELAEDFTRLPRSGSTVFAFVAAVYPTDQPVLPDADPASKQ